MRVASNDVSLINGFHAASAEAEAAFGDRSVYLEKYLERPRHIEFQILADTHGNVLHLGERDCSLQRRHQKLIEESPSPVMSAELRAAMGEAAVKFARGAGYVSAGTVEFLLDARGNFYFIEMNARIQVEHPVTEEVTGLDLIKEQLRCVAGEPLRRTQDDIELRGHAIEFRINAEDPDRNFAPSPGRIDQLIPPGGPGVRWDSHIYQGYTVPPHYDSLLGKLIIHRATRRDALTTARRALEEFEIKGVKTTIPLYLRILEHSDFISGEIDTGFIERFFTGK
jgi:acetyl-CoA carboxylase biotin carboxylase subunit